VVKLAALSRTAVLGAALILAGCTHTYSGNAPEDLAARPPAAWPGEIVGLERFDRDVTVVTFMCSSNVFRARHQATARDRIATGFSAAGYPQAGGTARVEVNDVEVRLGCHPAGFGGMGSFCRSDALVNLTLTTTDGRGRSWRGAARREAFTQHPAGVFCENGGKAIDTAVADAIDRTVADLVTQLGSSKAP
jgi:hypothetical protein